MLPYIPYIHIVLYCNSSKRFSRQDLKKSYISNFVNRNSNSYCISLSCQKVPRSDFQSQFSLSKTIELKGRKLTFDHIYTFIKVHTLFQLVSILNPDLSNFGLFSESFSFWLFLQMCQITILNSIT